MDLSPFLGTEDIRALVSGSHTSSKHISQGVYTTLNNLFRHYIWSVLPISSSYSCGLHYMSVIRYPIILQRIEVPVEVPVPYEVPVQVPVEVPVPYYYPIRLPGEERDQYYGVSIVTQNLSLEFP